MDWCQLLVFSGFTAARILCVERASGKGGAKNENIEGSIDHHFDHLHMTPDLERLRRFALGSALVLIAYVAAGVDLEGGASISLFGIPFNIHRPELLPLGLVLASSYSLVRFYYYGFMLSSSPGRNRKDLLHMLHRHGGHRKFKGSVILGPVLYSTTPSISDRVVVEEQLREVVKVFPSVWRARPQGTVKSHQTEDDGEPYDVYSAEITVPLPCRVATIFQDLDYSAPIWLNVGSLILAAAF